MQAFSIYRNELTDHINTILQLKQNLRNLTKNSSYINNTSYISNQLRKLISIQELRDAGTFFTDDRIANLAIDKWKKITKNSMILDPACGAGNLLIKITEKLPIKKTLTETLCFWGTYLSGFDLHEEFIETTKLRLIVHALERGAIPDTQDIELLKKFFFNIKTDSIFNNFDIVKHADYIIMNPPYNNIKTNKNYFWANGNINAAAIFLNFCIENAKDGCSISAILPEVLRSGSRYDKWRNHITKKIRPKIDTIGQFDTKTDIDVFILNGKIKNNIPNSKWVKSKTSKSILNDFFYISTGPVVPYRDAEEGILSPFIFPRNITAWQVINTNLIKNKRKYSGKLIKPPFVVIKRTSRPSDKFRAIATMIDGNLPVAVENHLIVLKPKSKKKKDCIALMEILKDQRTNHFLNDRIRCRHLTVTSVREIPWLGEYSG